ncbi:hypothetical protein V6C42_07205 [Pseudoclostridium thermosuccinogenes]|uniref:hypothetical protein n=1 Tax=Clostridium thermosuccinogenes TaxID=84032 RepID=UPI002FDA18C4
MKKILILALSMLLLLAACSKKEVISNHQPDDADFDGAVIEESAGNAIEADTVRISKIRIEYLYDGSNAEHTDSALIREFCALLAGQTYSPTDTGWDEDYGYRVELFDADGNKITTLVTYGSFVSFDSDVTVDGKMVKKGGYDAGQWISEYVREYLEGMVVDPVYLQYPASISIPDNISYHEIADHGSSKINTYETIEKTYGFLNNSVANNEFKILEGRRLFDYREIEAEVERVKAEGRCIQIEFNYSETLFPIRSSGEGELCAKAHIAALASVPGKPGVYKLITNSMIFEIEGGRDFDAEFDAIFEGNKGISKDLTPDDIKKLYEENDPYNEGNKPYYMDYICKNLGTDMWYGHPPQRIEITEKKLRKDEDKYTVVALSNYDYIRLHVFKRVDGQSWKFVDYIDFGGRNAGTEYRMESDGNHIWMAGNSCRGHGTGESRYYQDWYELTDEGKKLVLSFPYDEYSEYHMGGYNIEANAVNVETDEKAKVSVDYTITKIYPLPLDIADEHGRVSVQANKRVEFTWDESVGKFVSEHGVDDSGLSIIKPESPEITEKCDKILEKYYDELMNSLTEAEAGEEENSFKRDSRVGALKRFLDDCSDGDKKMKLMKAVEGMEE